MNTRQTPAEKRSKKKNKNVGAYLESLEKDASRADPEVREAAEAEYSQRVADATKQISSMTPNQQKHALEQKRMDNPALFDHAMVEVHTQMQGLNLASGPRPKLTLNLPSGVQTFDPNPQVFPPREARKDWAPEDFKADMHANAQLYKLLSRSCEPVTTESRTCYYDDYFALFSQ